MPAPDPDETGRGGRGARLDVENRRATGWPGAQASAVKIRNGQEQFIATPAIRMISFTRQARAGRTSADRPTSSPSSPSSLTKPPIGSQFSV